MNDNNLNNNNKVNTYKATSNLNTAIENPEMNVNSATGINIEDTGYNNYADNINNNTPNFLNNSYSVQDNSINNTLNNTTTDTSINNNQPSPTQENTSDMNNYNSPTTTQNVNYNYEPIMKEKKRADDNAISNLIHSKEFKIMIFIIFILVLFLLLMPYIYDFFRNLQMSLTA